MNKEEALKYKLTDKEKHEAKVMEVLKKTKIAIEKLNKKYNIETSLIQLHKDENDEWNTITATK